MADNSPFAHAVDAEVERARVRFPDQERTLTLAEWFAVLTEEVGEVARDINDTPRGDQSWTPETLDHLQLELVQVGAMAARMWLAVEGRR